MPVTTQTATHQIPAKDGTVLATDVYLPSGSLPVPVLLIRTPYSKKNMSIFGDFFVKRHYAVVIQDVRGTGDSGGSFDLFSQEPSDAEDTVRWILAQSWCNGRIGIIGVSYLASASIAVASLFPEQVKAAVWITIPVSADTLTWQGGALRLHHALPWALMHEGKMRDFQFPQAYSTLPVANASPPGTSPLWESLVLEGPGSRFWQENDLWEYVEKCRIPGLYFGGWFDFLLDATLKPYELMVESGAPQRLILGPWSHNGILQPRGLAGGVDYGPDSAAPFATETVAWFDKWLKRENVSLDLGKDSSPLQAEEGGIRCFFTGSDPGWRQYRKWPPEESQLTRFYLSERGLWRDLKKVAVTEMKESHSAQESDLVPEDGKETYTYDPMNPVPTEGGALWEFPTAGLMPGPLAQHSHLREDVLVYDTLVLDSPLRVVGPLTIVLYASSSCPDTDFTAKIVDVDEKDTARVVADGIIRARYRNGYFRPQLLEPGKVEEFRISLGACAHVFGKGHKLRLEISSSNFPKYDRNMNTKELPWLEESPVKADQEVYFGPKTPSRLELYCQE